MSFFRRKKEASLPKTSSLSIYGQGRKQSLQNSKKPEKNSESSSFSSLDLEDRPHPMAFAEATFDPSLPIKTKSRLSKDFVEVLNDNGALAYFIQFMDAKSAKHLIKFWLDVESFRVSSETKQNTEQEKKLVLAEDVHLPVPTIAGSGSSGYISDRSDDVFQSSSHTNTTSDTLQDSSSVNLSESHPCAEGSPSVVTEETRTHSNLTHSNVSNVNNMDVECAKDGCDGELANHDKFVHQSSSVDSGCDAKTRDSTSSIELQGDQGMEGKTLEGVEGTRNCDKCQESTSSKDGFTRLKTSMEQDALAIFSTYLTQEAPSAIDVPTQLREAIRSSIFRSSGDIDSRCFVPAQEYAMLKMEKLYYPNFLRSSFHCKYQIDVLTSGNVFFADVLYNDSALFFFMEFMEQEGVRHFVDFLLMADNFQKHLLSQPDSYDGVQSQTDAMVIYDKYFSLQATIPLGFSDSVRFEVEGNICQDGGPQPDCFSKPVNILTQYLEKTFLLQFLHSQLYFKYISECIISIQTDGNDSASQSKYTASDSGSEKSLPISSVNTLLAMDSKQPGTKIIKNLDDTDMRIDTRQFDPDALWQKKISRNLQMAHVDHLGRVTTEFEPDPEKYKESKISKAVKKLVNWEEDKNQEEMAWKVAEMIVNDICSVTMQTTKPNASLPAKNDET